MSAVIGVVTLLGFGFANSPANAVEPIRIFDGCTPNNAFLRVGVPYVMHVPSGCTPIAEWNFPSDSVIVSGGTVTITLKQDNSRAQVYFDGYTVNGPKNGSIFLACGNEKDGTWPYIDYCASTAPAEAPTTGAAEQGPRPLIHQGLPMPATGSCADVQDADYAWGTGLTGGWQKSWQPWVRSAGSSEPTGGWACIRTMTTIGKDTWVLAT